MTAHPQTYLLAMRRRMLASMSGVTRTTANGLNVPAVIVPMISFHGTERCNYQDHRPRKSIRRYYLSFDSHVEGLSGFLGPKKRT